VVAPDVGAEHLAEDLVGEVAAREPYDPEPLGNPALLVQVVQRRSDLAFHQVAGGTEDHQHGGGVEQGFGHG